jgi:hypothetical protein
VEWIKRLFPEHPGFAPAGAAVILALALFQSWQIYYFPQRTQWMETELGWSKHWLTAGEKVQELTEPDDPIVVDFPEDALIYYCDRPGWVESKYGLTEEALKSLIANGAEYLLITSYKMDGDRLTGYYFYDPPPNGAPGAEWVSKNCPVAHEGQIFQIVDLQPALHGRVSSATSATGERTDG